MVLAVVVVVVVAVLAEVVLVLGLQVYCNPHYKVSPPGLL